MRAHIVHGFNVSDGGSNTTDKLIPYLNDAGIETCQHDYGWFGLIRVRFCNILVADQIKFCADDGDIGLGHSNGCAILAQAAERGAKLSGVILVNPALDEDYVFPDQVKWVHVYHNRGDVAVWSARLLRFNHPWGAMGRVGFTGSDPRYTNFDCGQHGVSGHSDIFTKIDEWGPRIAGSVR